MPATTSLHFIRRGPDAVVISEPVSKAGIGELPYEVAAKMAASQAKRYNLPVLDLSGRK